MNLDQLRAQDAFAFVAGSAQRPADRADVLGVARQLPGMLQINGLLATWAHLLAKGGAEQRMAGAILSHFRRAGLAVPTEASERTILTEVWAAPGAPLSSGDLRRLTREAVVYAVWLKRAAEALCDTGGAAADANDEHAPAGDGAAAGDPR